MDKKKIPVIVGTAQLVHREKTALQLSPLSMMAKVGQMAATDASLGGLPRVDTLYVVNSLSKTMKTPTQDLSVLLDINPVETGYTAIGATAPQWYVNRAARRIYEEKSRWVIICGAEALYTEQKLPSMGQTLAHYFIGDEASLAATHIGDLRRPMTQLEMHYGLGLPVHVYSLFENALRAHCGQTMQEHVAELALFCSKMSKIAAKNPFAWSNEVRTTDEIAATSEENRMVCFPYTKLMCSNMNVNQAAAVLMTSLYEAEALGIPKENMVFLRGCGEAEDAYYVSERPDLWASPSVAEAVDQALSQVSLSLDEVEHLDLYSCFPSAVRIVARTLGLSPDDSRPLTITGGMPSFGGPGNNYTMHAICRMVEILRENQEAFGLVQALSWYISKHCVGIYSAAPGKILWKPHDREEKATKYPRTHVVEKPSGKVEVASYILVYGRDGRPESGTVIGTDQYQNRFLAKVKGTSAVFEAMTREEPIGKIGRVEHETETGTNWFYF